MDFLSVPFAVLGMNLNKRELNEHVEFESQTYYAAFAAELEACAQPMWGLLTHCKVKVRLRSSLHASHSSIFLFLKCSHFRCYIQSSILAFNHVLLQVCVF